jgi:hypothetical protein
MHYSYYCLPNLQDLLGVTICKATARATGKRIELANNCSGNRELAVAELVD